MAKPKEKGPGKHRKGLVKGAIAKVGVGEKSKTRFKRNPHKAKSRKGKVSPANQGKGKKGKEPKADQDGRTKEEGKVAAGEKRKDGSHGQGGSKRLKVSEQRKPHLKTPLSRKERRQLKRKKRKDFDLISQTLHLWERLRKHNLQETERAQLLTRTMELIAGRIREFALKHDTARVIQCCLKYGTPHQQTSIFSELKDHVVELSKSTYAKFTVKTLMRLCPAEQRDQLIAGLYGHVRSLVFHKEAAEVVEYVYNEHATAKQRSALLQEFYGRKFALFKTPETVGLEEVLAAVDGVQERESIMRHVMESLTKLLDKAVVKHSIVHKVFLDFLLHCNEASRTEMIEQLRELVVEMVHTREGSRVALHALWHGTTKDRKVIVKSFKPYVKRICMEEYGHVVMMGVFDCVDDTVLVKKNLLSELTPCLGELCAHQYGRRVLLYLLSPRNSQHFSSQFIQNVLAQGDGNKHTKKSPTVRYRELLDGLTPPLLSLAVERVGEWAVDKPHAPLLLQIAASLPGDITPLYEPLVEMLQMNFDPDNHIVTHPCGHWVVKRLLSGRQKKMEEKEEKEGGREGEKVLDEEERERGSLFAAMILDRVEADSIQSWTSTNRGAFVVCSLLKSGGTGVRERLQTILDPLSVRLQSGQLQGQQVLWRELTTCTIYSEMQTLAS